MIHFSVQRANTRGRAPPGLELQGKHSNSTPSTLFAPSGCMRWWQGWGWGGGECVVGAGLRSHITLFLSPEDSNQYFFVLILKWKTLGYPDSMAVPGWGGPSSFWGVLWEQTIFEKFWQILLSMGGLQDFQEEPELCTWHVLLPRRHQYLLTQVAKLGRIPWRKPEGVLNYWSKTLKFSKEKIDSRMKDDSPTFTATR